MKLGMQVEVDEWCTTVCHMTRSKVKVTFVRSRFLISVVVFVSRDFELGRVSVQFANAFAIAIKFARWRQRSEATAVRYGTNFFYRQDLPEGRYCFYSRADFRVFRPAGATCCTDQGEIWHRGADLRAKFHLDRSRGGGLRPPKLKKNWNFTNIIAPKGRVPCTIFLQNLQVLCVSSVYIILPNMAALFR